MIKLTTPIPKKIVRTLRAGDEVALTGTIVTGRDMAHHRLVTTPGKLEKLDGLLKGGVIYHCGPIIKKSGRKYSVVAAGPTTSARLEAYENDVIRKYKLSAMIGKGGMGPKTRAACVRYGAVYLEPTGGVAAYLARTIKNVREVFFLEEFGVPEAMWVLEVENLPAIVTIDSTGADLHERILKESTAARKELAG
jgi:tartrate/fumarate subfamily iron-sulfur-dependent hydro-lyase beta chain